MTAVKQLSKLLRGITLIRRYGTILVTLLILICLAIVSFSIKLKDNNEIHVVVIYAGQSKDWLDVYQNFSQPLLMNLEVESIDIGKTKKINLNKYDLVYPDKSILESSAGSEMKNNIIEYIKNGGSVFLENDFANWLPLEVLGAKSFEQINKLPDKLSFPETTMDINNMQNLIRDFSTIYKEFDRYPELRNKSYGYGMVASTASSIVKAGDISLYTLNQYGKGYVFFANPLLPNPWYISGFDMKPKNDQQPYFNNTVSAANQMIRNEFAAFVSKQKIGFALKKVYGPYGRPAEAWQNHFEVLSAIQQHSLEKWIDITRKYDEIPSYSLSRGVYEWFKRYETIGYQLNQGDNNNMAFTTEPAEAFYAPGIHPVVDGKWLNQNVYPVDQSYFIEAQMPYRAYPFVKDINNDGISDIVSGSFDGSFYYYSGISNANAWTLGKAEKLKLVNGIDLKVEGASAPVLYDINRDGKLDLISGCANGRIYCFENTGNFQFDNKGELVSMLSSEKLSAPDIGDIDGDGIDDLVAGTKSGDIYWFRGTYPGNILEFKFVGKVNNDKGTPLKPGSFSAPRLFDLDHDGRKDLVVGNADGYIRKFLNSKSGFIDNGYFDDKYNNDKGNKQFKYGNFAVPFFADINNDGNTDLVVGRLEYGQMAIAIDSPLFPYHKELETGIEYAKNNFVNIEPHFYTNIYNQTETEQHELQLHKNAFEQLGLQWEGNGTNQHTWQVSSDDSVQTFLNEYNSGLAWNSGFRPANSNVDPSIGAEYAWILPFYLCQDISSTQMLMFNTTNNLARLYANKGNWDTVVSYYRHPEYEAYKNPAELEKLASQLDQFRDVFNYNFMSEDQMAKSLMTQLNSKILVTKNPFLEIINMFQNNIRTMKQFNATLSPIIKKDKYGIMNGPYGKVTGVKVEPAEIFLSAPIDTDANVYMRKGSDLYIGLDKSVKIFISKNPQERFHIERVNLPVDIKTYNKGLKIKFLDGGLQQVKVNAPNNLTVLNSSEWKVENLGNNRFVLTRFGGPVELNISEP